MKKVSVSVVSGDITRVNADALVTAINASGAWFGGVDGAIFRVAGGIFHSQASREMPLEDGQTIVARSNGNVHEGAFANVVFVVDELRRPLHEVIQLGLMAASDAGFGSVSLPAIRTGVMLGAVEKTVNQAVNEMAKGVKNFLAENPDTKIDSIMFVIYGDKTIQSLLKKALW